MWVLICLRPHHSLLSPVRPECQLPLIITITFYFYYCWEIHSYTHVSVIKKNVAMKDRNDCISWYISWKQLKIIYLRCEQNASPSDLLLFILHLVGIPYQCYFFGPILVFDWPPHLSVLFTSLSSASWKYCETEWVWVVAPCIFYFNV